MGEGREKLYLLGHPIGHSKSPVMYNAVYRKLGLDWHYDLMDLPTVEEAESFLEAKNFLSINITTPYKPQAFAAADVQAGSAKLAHGANLLVQQKGHLLAYNTDGEGCVAYLERLGVDFRHKRVVVCGTGPTALSILNAVVQAGPDEAILLSRQKEKARRVLETYVDDYSTLLSSGLDLPAVHDHHLSFRRAFEEVELKFGSYDTSRQAISQADVVINATPLGMKPNDPAPFDTALLHEDQVAFDVVYGHGGTAFILGAVAAGCLCRNGSGMLVGQAVVTVEILFNLKGIESGLSHDELFQLMADAAGFDNL